MIHSLHFILCYLHTDNQVNRSEQTTWIKICHHPHNGQLRPFISKLSAYGVILTESPSGHGLRNNHLIIRGEHLLAVAPYQLVIEELEEVGIYRHGMGCEVILTHQHIGLFSQIHQSCPPLNLGVIGKERIRCTDSHTDEMACSHRIGSGIDGILLPHGKLRPGVAKQ